jgi:hypothetical protein
MKIRMTLRGTAPLLMHNQRLADPLDRYAKALKTITGKKKKTDEDHEEMARIEFEGGIYLDPTLGPFVPGVNVHRSLVEGARITKRGKDVERGLLVIDTVCPIAYTGPRDVASLYANKDHVSRLSAKVGQSRVMRTRPRFPEWALECDAEIDPGQLDFDDVCVIAETAGSMAGLGDYRPSSPHGGPHGRYTVVVEKV